MTGPCAKATRPAVSIALTIERGPHRGLQRSEILRRIRAMIHLLQLQKKEVSFVLTDDERIHELNRDFRKVDRPTDVLAFAMQEGEFGAMAGEVLGDVIVSVPTARRQAEARDVHVLDEVTMLLAHGLLHLLGWDHDTPAKDRRMRAETARLCASAEAAPAPAKRPAARAVAPAAGRTSRSRGTAKPAKPPAKRTSKPPATSTSKAGAARNLSRKQSATRAAQSRRTRRG